MSRHLERLLKIDALVRSDEKYTASKLAEELEVSERSIRYDLEFLKDRYHAPLQFTRAKGYHYADPTWNLPSVPLTQGELLALTLGAKMLEHFSETSESCF